VKKSLSANMCYKIKIRVIGMHDSTDINNIVIAVIFTSLGIVIPILFHLVGLGNIFLPMYLPLIAGAFLLNRVNAFMMGVCTPLISALLTGMPPFYPPIALIMSVQLGIVCFTISHLTHSFKAGVVVTLIIAIAIDRLLLAVFYYFIIPLFHIKYGLYTAYDLIKGLPGIVLVFILVPILVPRAVDVLNRYSLRLYEDKKEGRDGHP
jgi:hypothetical protein